MARIQPLHPEHEPEPVESSRRARRHPEVPAGVGLRVGAPGAHLDTPSHVPGTNKGEETIFRTPEKGHRGRARTARSATSINPGARAPIDPRMPHLPPN